MPAAPGRPGRAGAAPGSGVTLRPLSSIQDWFGVSGVPSCLSRKETKPAEIDLKCRGCEKPAGGTDDSVGPEGTQRLGRTTV